jgi:hypothetical protein
VAQQTFSRILLVQLRGRYLNDGLDQSLHQEEEEGLLADLLLVEAETEPGLKRFLSYCSFAVVSAEVPASVSWQAPGLRRWRLQVFASLKGAPRVASATGIEVEERSWYLLGGMTQQ